MFPEEELFSFHDAGSIEDFDSGEGAQVKSFTPKETPVRSLILEGGPRPPGQKSHHAGDPTLFSCGSLFAEN